MPAAAFKKHPNLEINSEWKKSAIFCAVLVGISDIWSIFEAHLEEKNPS